MMVMEEGIVIEVKGDRVFVNPQQSDRFIWCPPHQSLGGRMGGSIIGNRFNLGVGSDLLAIGLGLGLTGISFLKVKQYIHRHDRDQTYRPVVIEIVNGKGL